MRGFEWVFGGNEGRVIRECRHCGTTVEVDCEVCPNCDHDGIAVYEFD